jgi:GNAT superfamily N-acetyltransferase
VIRPLVGHATAQQIVDLGREMTMESRFARLGYVDELALAHAQCMLTAPHFIGFGLFSDAFDLVGFISGVCGATLPWTPAVVSHQHLLYITPKHRGPWAAAKLIQAFLDEARARGSVDDTFSNGTGYEPERVGRLFEICGLSHVGGLYVKES